MAKDLLAECQNLLIGALRKIQKYPLEYSSEQYGEVIRENLLKCKDKLPDDVSFFQEKITSAMASLSKDLLLDSDKSGHALSNEDLQKKYNILVGEYFLSTLVDKSAISIKFFIEISSDKEKLITSMPCCPLFYTEDIQVIEMLVNLGADVNAPNPYMHAPSLQRDNHYDSLLHWYGRKNVLQTIIKHHPLSTKIVDKLYTDAFSKINDEYESVCYSFLLGSGKEGDHFLALPDIYDYNNFIQFVMNKMAKYITESVQSFGITTHFSSSLTDIIASFLMHAQPSYYKEEQIHYEPEEPAKLKLNLLIRPMVDLKNIKYYGLSLLNHITFREEFTQDVFNFTEELLSHCPEQLSIREYKKTPLDHTIGRLKVLAKTQEKYCKTKEFLSLLLKNYDQYYKKHIIENIKDIIKDSIEDENTREKASINITEIIINYLCPNFFVKDEHISFLEEVTKETGSQESSQELLGLS